MLLYRLIKGIIIFFFLSPLLSLAAELLDLSRSSIFLSESHSMETVRLGIRTKNFNSFFLTVQDINHGNFAPGANEFILKSTLPNIEGSVRVALDLPYIDRSSSGLTQANSINRVINQKRTKTSDQYSLCPNSNRICKPLTIVVTDDSEAISGIRYSSILRITAESDDGLTPPSTKSLTINYQRKGSAIGLKSSTNHALMSPC